ncbi:MAG: ThiF family adenylyltransferase [Flavobacteriales bacterium]
MNTRYQRQIILPEIGEEGQNRMTKSHILVVGAGGLGCSALTYLVASGIGKITIIDNDIVSENNLNRQVLYGLKDVGKSKVEIARKKLLVQNKSIKIYAINEELNLSNAKELISNKDVVLDCTDNMASRYLLSDVCELTGTPLVFAGIHRFQGQITVFHHKNKIGYRDLFPYDANKEQPSSCNENGVLGVLKIIANFGDVLDGKMMVFNLLNAQSQIFKVNKSNLSKIVELEQLPEYEHLCQTEFANCISVSEFFKMDLEKINLVDIRDEEELPKSKLKITSESDISEKTVVLLCQTGKRTRNVLPNWVIRYPEKTIYSLKGGVLALNERLLIKT